MTGTIVLGLSVYLRRVEEMIERSEPGSIVGAIDLFGALAPLPNPGKYLAITETMGLGYVVCH